MTFARRLTSAFLSGLLGLSAVACVELQEDRGRQSRGSQREPVVEPVAEPEVRLESPSDATLEEPAGESVEPVATPSIAPLLAELPMLPRPLVSQAEALSAGQYVIVEGVADCMASYFSEHCRPQKLVSIQVTGIDAARKAILAESALDGLAASTVGQAKTGAVFVASGRPAHPGKKSREVRYLLAVERDKFVRTAFREFFYFDESEIDRGIDDELIGYLGQELFISPAKLMPLYDGDESVVRGHFDFHLGLEGRVMTVVISLQPDEFIDGTWTGYSFL